jgi:hypothetical protein
MSTNGSTAFPKSREVGHGRRWRVVTKQGLLEENDQLVEILRIVRDLIEQHDVQQAKRVLEAELDKYELSGGDDDE